MDKGGRRCRLGGKMLRRRKKELQKGTEKCCKKGLKNVVDRGRISAVDAAGGGSWIRTEESLFYICYGDQASVYLQKDCILTVSRAHTAVPVCRWCGCGGTASRTAGGRHPRGTHGKTALTAVVQKASGAADNFRHSSHDTAGSRHRP